MTDPLTPERLAELRRIATGEDWSPAQPQDVAVLLGEIDRLTAENAKLATERDELARILREAIAESGLTFDELQAADADKPTAPVVAAARRTRDRLTAWLDSALDATLPQDDPQRPAEGFEASPAAPGPEYLPGHPGKLAQRPSWLDPQPRQWTAEDVATYRLDHCGNCRDAEFYGYSGHFAREAHAKHVPLIEDGHGPLSGQPCACATCAADVAVIAPEDEGISSADVTAQAASDARHERFEIDSEGLAVPCRTCEGRGSTSYGADCPDCEFGVPGVYHHAYGCDEGAQQ